MGRCTKKSIVSSFNYSIRPAINLISEEYNFVGVSELEKLAVDNRPEEVYDAVEPKLTKMKELLIDGSVEWFNSCETGIAKRYIECVNKIINTNVAMNLLKDLVDGIFLHLHTGVQENALIKIGNSFGIPTILLLNGVLISKNSPKLIEASHVFCNSKFHRDLFIELGIDEDKLYSTGLPYFDLYHEKKPKKYTGDNVTILCGFDMEFSKSETLGGWVRQYFSIPHEKFFLLHDVAERMPNYTFIWKVKPHGLLSMFSEEFFKEIPTNVKIEWGPWDTYVEDCDCCVCSPTSTVLVETIASGVPIVTAKMDPRELDFMDANVREVEWTVDNICSAIEDSLGSKSGGKEFMDYYFSYNLDGKASERVADRIRRIVA